MRRSQYSTGKVSHVDNSMLSRSPFKECVNDDDAHALNSLHCMRGDGGPRTDRTYGNFFVLVWCRALNFLSSLSPPEKEL